MEINTYQTSAASDPMKRLLIIGRLTMFCIVGTHSWDQNLFVQLTHNVTNALNLTDCWVCSAFSRGSTEFPLYGVMVSQTNWSWPFNHKGFGCYESPYSTAGPLYEVQKLENSTIIRWNDTNAPQMGWLNLNYTALNWSVSGPPILTPSNTKGKYSITPECRKVHLDMLIIQTYRCLPQGLWWLCGDGRARKRLPN